jgi:O-acetyl-ADP-ribose deacetylase (regulator of RNase III)
MADITALRVDAIANAANTELVHGRGAGAIEAFERALATARDERA